MRKRFEKPSKNAQSKPNPDNEGLCGRRRDFGDSAGTVPVFHFSLAEAKPKRAACRITRRDGSAV